MAQGFKNGGVYRTDLSFPAILARSFDPPIDFQMPSFTAQTGIPINMEMLVRGLSDEYGDEITWNQYVGAGAHLFKTLRRIKTYWGGKMKPLNVEREIPYHNLAVWGIATSDVWLLNDLYCKQMIKNHRPEYSIFSVLPDHAMYTTARMVLNPTMGTEFETFSMLDNLKWLQNSGGVENLISCVGHNNIVGAITNLEIIYSEEEDLIAPHGKRKCTVYRPEHFERETRTLYEKISEIGVDRVFVPTLPYITIPPAIRGVNEDRSIPDGLYFDYYTRFWIWDEDFEPEKHPHLTKDDAITLDHHVDEYNTIIKSLAGEFGFHVVPIAKFVSDAARRRLGSENVRAFPKEFIQALKNNPKTSYLVDDLNHSRISTDYIRLCDDSDKIDRGGIFSLDGLHPSTIGYGMIANIYQEVMENHGVKFGKPFDWDFVIENETLVTDPPVLMKDLRLLLRFLALGRNERFTMISKNLLLQVLEQFTASAEVE